MSDLTRKEFLEKCAIPEYIDDTIYARFDGYNIVLEVRKGLVTNPMISIEIHPGILEKLIKYKDEVYREYYNLKS